MPAAAFCSYLALMPAQARGWAIMYAVVTISRIATVTETNRRTAKSSQFCHEAGSKRASRSAKRCASAQPLTSKR